jgi:6-phosphogluconolactonase
VVSFRPVPASRGRRIAGTVSIIEVMQSQASNVIVLMAALALSGCGSEGARAPGAGGVASGGTGGAGGAPSGSAGLGGSMGAVLQPMGGNATSSTGGTGSSVGVAGSSGSSGSSGSGGSGGSGPIGIGAGPASGATVIYVGGFGTDPILAYDVDSSGAVTPHGGPIDAGPEPSCFALDRSRKHLYVCNEDDGEGGGVTSFAIEAQGSLTRINHRTGSDLGFTALAADPSGKWLAGASYSGGSASLFPLLEDGSVGAEASMQDFGDDAQSHCVAYDPASKFLFVTTKGADQVQQLLLGANGKLGLNSPPSVATPASAGPRHIAVHPNGKLLWVINERGSSITTYQIAAGGTLTRGETIPSVPADYQGANTGAHIELSPGSTTLYVSNRGHDSIGVYGVNADTGALTLLEHEPSRGSAPHDFDIDEQGRLLAAINRKSSTLVLFAIAADGSLSPLGQAVPTRSDPTAVLIVHPRL